MPNVSHGLSDNSNHHNQQHQYPRPHSNHQSPLISIRLINRTISDHVWPATTTTTTNQAPNTFATSAAVTEAIQTNLFAGEKDWNQTGISLVSSISTQSPLGLVEAVAGTTIRNASLPESNLTAAAVPYNLLNQFANSTTTTATFILDSSNQSNSNDTFKSNVLHFWEAISFTHPDILLAFALIIFYVIFVLFICIIVIRIGVAIIFTKYSAAKVPDIDRDQYSLNGFTEGELSSSKCRGISGYSSRFVGGGGGGGHRYHYHQEMTSYAIDRTNSPSMIDEYENES